ncbi:hypothetical protein QFC21_003976 [Naganishia friedmannii]|uniref:Uncharacterized protein n=1 Tax=Naganishia friedmannii TaxID=89922 RepID=A0ACC2VKQ0_9TREE|nr:hypothetical protein QFC21_003976 [Naganishia friedmannii]
MGTSQSTPKITSRDKSILDLKVQRDKLKQYQKKASLLSSRYAGFRAANVNVNGAFVQVMQLQLSLDAEQQAAKQALANGQKTRALQALRQKKYHESLLLKTDDQLMTLTELLSTIEFSQIQQQVLQSLNKGSQVLSELQKDMSLTKVEGIMDRVGEGVAAQREIDEALMSKLSPEEEESVLAELETLQEQALPSIPSTIPAAPVRLPDVPLHQPLDSTAQDAEDAAERREERQKQREDDLRVAMAA